MVNEKGQRLQNGSTSHDNSVNLSRAQLKEQREHSTANESIGARVSFEEQLVPQHNLLFLSDSALPLGSFAFSNGLESYLAHPPPRASFSSFLSLSIDSLASTTLPYILTAFRHPERLSILDNDIDASTPCIVARRSSVAQGRALLGIWERALQPITRIPYESSAAESALSAFSSTLKSSAIEHTETQASGHFAPLWAVICASRGLSLHDTAYVFLLNHAKAVLSAAVRASVMGPYQAQGLLASDWLQDAIKEGMRKNWETPVEEAGQSVPVLDLWVGRHELLYSRIFNS